MQVFEPKSSVYHLIYTDSEVSDEESNPSDLPTTEETNSEPTVEKIKPVSYTHLDVYKRQPAILDVAHSRKSFALLIITYLFLTLFQTALSVIPPIPSTALFLCDVAKKNHSPVTPKSSTM